MAGSRLVPAEKVAESAKSLSNKRKKKSGKGKSRDDQSEDSDESEGSSVSAETDDGSEPDFDPVDVSFEFFDPQSQDYEAIKRLLIQLFGPDAQTLQIDGLVDLILAQGTIGSTVKVDGHESDPYAILTVLNLSQAEEPTLINLKEYFWQKVNHSKTVWSSPSGSRRLQQLLKTSTSKVGLVISERLVNMPVQILPPMLDMLQEEIEWAVADKESYQFDWWLVPTRVYQCVQSALGEDDGVEGQSKSQKKKKAKQRHASKEGLESTGGSKFESFHPEDEIISKYAIETVTYNFTHHSQTVPDSQRAFTDYGIDPHGRLMLIPNDQWRAMIAALKEALQGS